jgi:phosphatidylglycerol lysyltransferase
MTASPNPAETATPNLSARELWDLLVRFGTNSNAFLVMYPGYRYFHPEGLPGTALGYIETGPAWIGACEPLAPPEQWPEIFRAFAQAARARGKNAIVLPVGEPARRCAEAGGWGSIKLGGEPFFALSRYQPSVDIVSTARRLSDRGARVVEFRYEKLAAEKKRELDELVLEWLGSRKMHELGFVNRVEPWALSERKKYFAAELDGKTVAFVAAVPIPAGNGWYLIDVFRRERSPAGATEILLLEAMRILKSQGAERISLGVAPLSDLGPEVCPERTWLTRFLHLVYRHGGLAYNFRSLHQYKLKFKPTQIEPAYLVYWPNRLRVRTFRAVSEAFVGSPLKALRSSLSRRLRRLDWIGAIEQRLTQDYVLRPVPKDIPQLLGRIPFTLTLFALLVTLFLGTSDAHSQLSPELARRYAFTWDALRHREITAILGSAFLHGGALHLTSNLLLLVFGVGTLEYFRGTTFTTVSYAIAMCAANPVTAAVYWPTRWFAPAVWSTLLAQNDVGASLGIFGCVGALVTILRQESWVFAVLAVFYTGYTLTTGRLLAMSHVTAVGIGILLQWWL